MSGRKNLWNVETKEIAGVEMLVLHYWRNNRIVKTEGILPEEYDPDKFSAKAAELNPTERTYLEWLKMHKIC